MMLIWTRALVLIVTLIAVFSLVACSDATKEAKGEKGEKGEPGADGPPGPKGDPGTTLRVVAPQSSVASCQTDEIMISAYCTGTFNAYPLVPLTNGARCGANPNSTTLRVTIVCAKR
jgi:hypothetical protein